MTKGIRALFTRNRTKVPWPNSGSYWGRWLHEETQPISLRASFENHHEGEQLGLQEATDTFTETADGNGFVRGCHRPTQLIAGDLAYVVPSWVAAADHDTRTIEGVLFKSKISGTDFPAEPWHTYYDWNFFIALDRQYTYLASSANSPIPSDYWYLNQEISSIECEWDTAYLPMWAWPQEPCRIWMVGRWIYDCGHPEGGKHRSEIHPPKAVAHFRREATRLPGTSDLVPATIATVFIGREGGYWRQSINDQDYTFDLELPDKPSAESEPTWVVNRKTPSVQVSPEITPFPALNPKVLRVRIPLEGTMPHPETYGVVISAGWTNPQSSRYRIRPVRVTLQSIHMEGDYDTGGDEWYVYICVNGRWKVYTELSGWDADLNHSVDVNVPLGEEVRITANGFEADAMHDAMGRESHLSWDAISDPGLTVDDRETIEDYLFDLLFDTWNDENDKIDYVRHTISYFRLPTTGSLRFETSQSNDYWISGKITAR